MRSNVHTQIILIVVALIFMVSLGSSANVNRIHSDSYISSVGQLSASIPSNYSFYNYNPRAAISYAMLVHTKYFGSKYYPSGLNLSVLQKNLDYFNSEDCAHFVSEALIAGGLTELSVDAPNGPADNLSGYDGGQFLGSYGIVGVYRLVSYLLGYVPSVFSTNETAESTLGYQPVPASFQGSPFASVYYVLNESMLPSYYLSPGDVIADGGVGAGHIMLYSGDGTVVQTDPAEVWEYQPGIDQNISFYGLDTLDGRNVSAMYVHIPTFHGQKTVNITVLNNGRVLSNGARINPTSSVYIIGTFPDGVGLGNYSYVWTDNGKVISAEQNFTFRPLNGINQIEVKSTGSNGTAYQNFTLYYGSKSTEGFPFGALLSGEVIIVIAAISATVVIAGTFIYFLSRRKKSTTIA
jgi:hypothetical protein